jgi:hypothetical protein
MMATTPIEGQYGVRSELNARGIDDSRIGYNKNTGFVTIDGQNFIQPENNIKGTTYADPTAFDQNFNLWGANSKMNTAAQNVEQAMTQPAVNPYDQQVSDAMSQYYDKMTNPTPYDVYSSPEYAAYQAQADRQSQRSIRTAQESMGAANFGRSTNLADRAQDIQNDANEYMQLQVTPQLQAANAQKQQQELANFGSYMEMLTGQQGMFDTRTQNGLQNSMAYLNYLSGQRNQFSDEAYRTGRDQVVDDQWKQSFDTGNQQWQQQFDEGVRQYDETSAMQEEQWQKSFDEDVRQFGLNYALQKDAERRAAANAAADNRRADAAASRAATNDKLSALYKQWDATGVAPAGIPGVAAGTPMGGGSVGGLSSDDLKTEASEMLGALRSGDMTPEAALSQIEDDMKVGFYSSSDAAYLRSLIQGAAPTAPAKTTAAKNDYSEYMKTVPSDKEIEKEAKSNGYPTMDYRSWYKSPQGRAAGTDFKTWQSLYGPRLQ